MPVLQSRKLRLPSHYYVWSEPPDDSGDEVLHFVSERRRIKIKGRSFREFERSVLPLLDGRHTVEEIEQSVAHLFAAQDLRQCFDLLASQNLLGSDVDEQQMSAASAEALIPQLNFFHEVGANTAEIQRRLLQATVTVVGLGGPGAQTAMSLAATRVGRIRCIDTSTISGADTYFSPMFSLHHVGASRAAVVAEKIGECSPETKTVIGTETLNDDSDVLSAIEGSDFVVCCLDRGQSSLIYKLNRACWKAAIPWTSCALSGAELILGPTVHPTQTACFLCYKMRAVACAGNPSDEFSYERFRSKEARRQQQARKSNVWSGPAWELARA